jgi:hypothetical protein
MPRSLTSASRLPARNRAASALVQVVVAAIISLGPVEKRSYPKRASLAAAQRLVRRPSASDC